MPNVSKLRHALLVALSLTAASVLLAVQGPARAATDTGRPACIETAQRLIMNPGGNGDAYLQHKYGVYGWIIYFVHPLPYTKNGVSKLYKGEIYAGSGDLRIRRRNWKDYWATGVRQHAGWEGSKFVFRVLTRDWDIPTSGPIPNGFKAVAVRAGAEQIAITTFDKWGERRDFWLHNTHTHLEHQYSGEKRAKWLQDATELFQKQLENNAKAGTAKGDGDELNWESEAGEAFPSDAMAGLPGYGSGASKCN